jgi:SAM-dependent methyltransferase
MEDAFKTWDAADESLEAIEARIHDGVERDRLGDRARGYARRIFTAAPWLSLRPSSVVVEVGPGVAYVMQAVADLARLDRIRGLDVAAAMVSHARARLRRDGLAEERFQLELYDGVTFPWPDAIADLVYSVAAIQHVPKPFAYNILFEMHRCLAAGGTAVVHVLNWSAVTKHGFSLRDEVQRQIQRATTHWHHFYDETEIRAVVEHTLQGTSVRIAHEGKSTWIAWRK